MRRVIALIATVVAMLAFNTPVSQAHDPFCGIRWGSIEKVDADMSAATLVNVRAGRHACFDRLVLDFNGDLEGYRASYVSTVRQDGSGLAVPLRGGADLQIVATGPANSSSGKATYVPRSQADLVSVAGWETFRQVAWAGSFEGQTTIGLGVRARLPFRVFILDGPGGASRLVIDVAHFWTATTDSTWRQAV
jgi:hypothetical protein